MACIERAVPDPMGLRSFANIPTTEEPSTAPAARTEPAVLALTALRLCAGHSRSMGPQSPCPTSACQNRISPSPISPRSRRLVMFQGRHRLGFCLGSDLGEDAPPHLDPRRKLDDLQSARDMVCLAPVHDPSGGRSRSANRNKRVHTNALTSGAVSRRDNAAMGPNSASPSPQPRSDSYGLARRDARGLFVRLFLPG